MLHGQGGVASAKNDIPGIVDINLSFQRLSNIDFGQHAKTLFLEGFLRARYGFVKRDPKQTIDRQILRIPSAGRKNCISADQKRGYEAREGISASIASFTA